MLVDSVLQYKYRKKIQILFDGLFNSPGEWPKNCVSMEI